MIQEELDDIEKELKKRFVLPYQWGRKQNNEWDKHSSFIYEIREWELLMRKVDDTLKRVHLNREEFLGYASNRWYNFWSSVAVEKIFSNLPGVVPAYNQRDRLVDFKFLGKDFDHKTTVFPKAFAKDLRYAQQHPRELISWLYANQSSQQRQHFGNRIFLVVYAENGEHWKVKAEISFLKRVIEEYVEKYRQSKLLEFDLKPGKTTFSDIIWAIQ